MIIIGLTLIMNWVNSDHISKNWIHSLFHIRSHFCSPVEVVEVEDESTQLEKEEQELLKDLSSGEWSDTLADQEKRVGEFFDLVEENGSKVNHYFQTVFRTFLRHKLYIKNTLETDYSNAKLEATNKLIKGIKRLGFGFRNFINFKNRVFITLNIHKKRTYPVLSRC